MPLSPGSSREVVSSNIREMMASGYPQKQAVAASLSNARRHPRARGGLVNFADGGKVDDSKPTPDDAAQLVDVMPKPPAYINTLERLHEGRMRAQGIPLIPDDWEALHRLPTGEIAGDRGLWGMSPRQLREGQGFQIGGMTGQPAQPGSMSPARPMMLPPQPPGITPYPSAAAPQPAPSGMMSPSQPMPMLGPGQQAATARAMQGGLVQMPGSYAGGGLTEQRMGAMGRQAGYEARNAPGVRLIHSAVPGRTDRIAMSARPGSYVMPADVVSGMGQGNTMAGAKMWGQAISRAIGSEGMGKMPRGHAPSLPRTSTPRFSPMRLPNVAVQSQKIKFQEGGRTPGLTQLAGDVVPLPITPGPHTGPPSEIRLGLSDTRNVIVPEWIYPHPQEIQRRWYERPGRAEGGSTDPDHEEDYVPIVTAGGELVLDPEIVEAIGGGDAEAGRQLLHECVLSMRKQVAEHNKKLPEPVE